MPGSVNVTVTNMELTPARVTWGGTDIGGILKNVSVKIKKLYGDIKADQYGETILDRRLTGMEVSMTTEFTEVRNLQTWVNAFPSSTLNGTAPNQSITFQLPTGYSQSANAKQLVIHPLVKADTDLTNDYTFYLAHPAEETDITYGPKDQSTIKMTWNIYPVVTGGAFTGEASFFKYGLPSVGTP